MPLVLVPTPLGNLRDITLRALDALGACDLVVAEDTRVALRLLSALGIMGKPIWSYREQNAATATPGILARARTERIVLVTDAGMPGISDPGRELVAAARAQGVAIEALPGPTAFVCAAVLSGFDLTGMSFEGFPPRTARRRLECFAAALERGRTSLWYEAPTRALATLATIGELAPEARVFLARELTKRFEQQLLGTAAEVAAALERPVRGEIAFALEAPARHQGGAERARDGADTAAMLEDAIGAALAAGEAPSALAKRLARAGLGTRAAIYDRIAARRRG